MTKEGYFEMCEALGSKPIPEEIPVDVNDLAHETILALNCYGMLSDNWSSMGSYMGKHLFELGYVLELNEVSNIEKEYVIDTIRFVDNIVSKDIAQKQKQQSKAK